MPRNNRYRVGVLVAEFNESITSAMLAGALKTLTEQGVPEKNITVVQVPGCFELPLACQRLAQTGKYNGLIALGAVIKGDTDHYYYVAGEASRGVMEVMLKFSLPIGFGIITTNTMAQARIRSSGTHNKGVDAALALLQMLSTGGA